MNIWDVTIVVPHYIEDREETLIITTRKFSWSKVAKKAGKILCANPEKYRKARIVAIEHHGTIDT